MAKKKNKQRLEPGSRDWLTVHPAIRASYWSARCSDSDYEGQKNPVIMAHQEWLAAADKYEQDGRLEPAAGARKWAEYYRKQLAP